MRTPDPALTHSRSTAEHSGPFSFLSLGARAHGVLGALVFLAFSVATTHAQWQSFDRQGEEFRALAVSDTLVYALTTPFAIHISRDHGQSWTGFSGLTYATCEGYSIGILDGTCIAGSGHGDFLVEPNRFQYGTRAVEGVTDDILAVISTRRGSLSTWYLGGFGGGVRRSTDKGKTWALCNEGLTELNVTSLVTIAAPGDTSQVLFAGTYGGGVFRSDDDGLHWTVSSAGLDDLHLNAVIAHGDTLYTAHSGGRVSRSTNAGSTWSTLGTGLPYTDVLCLAPMTSSAEGGIVAGTIDRGVWRYAPSTGVWEPVNTGLRRMRINTIIAHDGVLILGTDRGLYRSMDHGSSWLPADKGAIPNVNDVHATNIAPGTPGTRIFTESDPHYQFYEGYRGQSSGPNCKVSWTDDFGLTWTTIPFFTDYVTTAIHNECVLVFKTRSHDSDVLRCILSTDRGTTWGDEIHFYGPLYCGVTGLMIRDVPAEHRFEIYFTVLGGPTPGMCRSLDSAKTWSGVKYLDGEPITMGPLLATDSLIYAACSQFALVSSNSGATWTPVTYNGVSPYSAFTLLHANGPLLYASVAPDIVPGDPGGLYISSDRGTTWTNAGLTGHRVGNLIECDSVLFATLGGYIFAARTGVLEWKDVSGNLAAGTLCQLTSSSEYVVALTSAADMIWYRPMSEIRAILKEIPSQVLLITPHDGAISDSTRMTFRWARLTGASAYALQLSEDPTFSASMLVDSSGITDTSFAVPVLVKGRTYYWRVRASNDNGPGLWSAVRNVAISPTATGVGAGDVPTSFALRQNYPNPFNPATTIGYDVPFGCNVTMTVFDLLGRELAVLVDEHKAAGRYEVRFDASGLSSGVYFYRLQAAGAALTRSLVVVR